MDIFDEIAPKGDIFDEIAPKGDIFDEIAPRETVATPEQTSAAPYSPITPSEVRRKQARLADVRKEIGYAQARQKQGQAGLTPTPGFTPLEFAKAVITGQSISGQPQFQERLRQHREEPVTQTDKALLTERIAEQNALEAELAQAERPSTKEMGFLGGVKAAAKAGAALPYVSTLKGGQEAIDISQATERFQSGTASPEDVQLLKIAAAEEATPKTWGYTVGRGLTALPGYAGEFGITQPIYAAGKKLAGAGLRKLAGKGIEGKLTKAGIWAGERAAGVAAQTLAVPGEAVAGVVQRITPDVSYIDDGEGNARLQFSGKTQDITTAIGKELGRQFIEVGSERSGAILAKPFVKLLDKFTPESLKAGILNRWLKTHPNKTIQDGIAELRKETAWNGLVGEVLEEEVGKPLRALFGITDVQEGQQPEIKTRFKEEYKNWLSDFASEVAIMAVPAGLGATLRAIPDKREKPASILRRTGEPVTRESVNAEIAARMKAEAEGTLPPEAESRIQMPPPLPREQTQGQTAQLVMNQAPDTEEGQVAELLRQPEFDHLSLERKDIAAVAKLTGNTKLWDSVTALPKQRRLEPVVPIDVVDEYAGMWRDHVASLRKAIERPRTLEPTETLRAPQQTIRMPETVAPIPEQPAVAAAIEPVEAAKPPQEALRPREPATPAPEPPKPVQPEKVPQEAPKPAVPPTISQDLDATKINLSQWGNKPRMKYDKRDLYGAINSAIGSMADKPKYIFATTSGYTISDSAPPGQQRHVVIRADKRIEVRTPTTEGGELVQNPETGEWEPQTISAEAKPRTQAPPVPEAVREPEAARPESGKEPLVNTFRGGHEKEVRSDALQRLASANQELSAARADGNVRRIKRAERLVVQYEKEAEAAVTGQWTEDQRTRLALMDQETSARMKELASARAATPPESEKEPISEGGAFSKTPEVLYHGTTQGALRKIASEGLKPTTMNQVSLSETEQYAKTYADRKGGARGVVLRVKDVDATQDTRISVKGDFRSSEVIPVDKIEVKMPDGAWAPLSGVDISIGTPEIKPSYVLEGDRYVYKPSAVVGEQPAVTTKELQARPGEAVPPAAEYEGYKVGDYVRVKGTVNKTPLKVIEIIPPTAEIPEAYVKVEGQKGGIPIDEHLHKVAPPKEKPTQGKGTRRKQEEIRAAEVAAYNKDKAAKLAAELASMKKKQTRGRKGLSEAAREASPLAALAEDMGGLRVPKGNTLEDYPIPKQLRAREGEGTPVDLFHAAAVERGLAGETDTINDVLKKLTVKKRMASEEKWWKDKIAEVKEWEKTGSETVHRDKLGVGDTFQIRGEKFTVLEETDTALRIADGVEYILPYEAVGERATLRIDNGSLRKAKAAPKAPEGQLFAEEEMPFNLAGETVKSPETKPTEREVVQTEMFPIEKLVESKDPRKSADAAIDAYGTPAEAIRRINRQLSIVDSDPAQKKAFVKEQRIRLKEVLKLLEQRAGKEKELTIKGMPVEAARGATRGKGGKQSEQRLEAFKGRIDNDKEKNIWASTSGTGESFRGAGGDEANRLIERARRAGYEVSYFEGGDHTGVTDEESKDIFVRVNNRAEDDILVTLRHEVFHALVESKDSESLRLVTGIDRTSQAFREYRQAYLFDSFQQKLAQTYADEHNPRTQDERETYISDWVANEYASDYFKGKTDLESGFSAPKMAVIIVNKIRRYEPVPLGEPSSKKTAKERAARFRNLKAEAKAAGKAYKLLGSPGSMASTEKEKVKLYQERMRQLQSWAKAAKKAHTKSWFADYIAKKKAIDNALVAEVHGKAEGRAEGRAQAMIMAREQVKAAIKAVRQGVTTPDVTFAGDEAFIKAQETLMVAVGRLREAGEMTTGRETVDTLRNFWFEVKSMLPMSERGKVVPAMLTMRTNADYWHAQNRLEAVIATWQKRTLIAGIKRLAKRVRKSKAIAIEYKTQINKVLDDFLLRKPSAMSLARLQLLQEQLVEAANTNANAEIPLRVAQQLRMLYRLDKGEVRPISDLNANQLASIYTEMKTLFNAGIWKKETRDAIDEMRKEEDLARMTEQGVANVDGLEGEKQTSPLDPAFSSFKGKISDNIRRGMDNSRHGFLWALTPDRFFDYLDKAQYYGGVMMDIFRHRPNRAFAVFMDEYTRLKDEFEKAVKEAKLTDLNMARLGVYAAAQQKTGRERLLNRGDITEAQIDAIVLTPEEQHVYELARKQNEELKPFIKEFMARVHNMPFKEEEDYSPFMTDWDVTDHYLGNFSMKADTGEVYRKNPEAGFTKERRGAGKQKIRIDFANIHTRHLRDALYLIYMGETTKYMGELARSEEFGNLVGAYGQKIVLEYVDSMARGSAVKDKANVLLRALEKLSRNVGVFVIGGRVSSTLVQFSSLFNGAAMLGGDGALRVAGALSDIATDKKAREFIWEFSEVKHRMFDDPAFLDFGDKGAIHDIRKAAFWLLQRNDGITAASVALAAYRKYAKERGIDVDYANPVAEGINYAQDVVRSTQSSSRFKDQPLFLMRGKLGGATLTRLLMQFKTFQYSADFLLSGYDAAYYAAKRGEWGRAFNIMVMLMLASMLAVGIRRGTDELFRELLDKKRKKKQDEFYMAVLKDRVMNVPVVGEIMGFLMYERNPVPLFEWAGETLEDARYAYEGKREKTRFKHGSRAVVEGVGGALGLPASEILRIVKILTE